jgi:2-methylisocitrate lyase-like PEP mutase family enzyme
LAVERLDPGVQAYHALRHDFVLTTRRENFLWGRPDLDDTIKRALSGCHARPGLPT